jgi:hypothetical protein
VDTRRIHRISRLALAILSAWFVIGGVAAILGGAGGPSGWLLVVVGVIGLVMTARDLPGR